MDFTLEDISEFLNDPASRISVSATKGYTPTFQQTPASYIRYTKDNVIEGREQDLINAFTNAKRAIDCRVEGLMQAYGLNNGSSRSMSFPAKQQRLARINISFGTVLGRIVGERNVIEHEFSAPEPIPTKEALEIAEMFVHATDKYLTNYRPYFEVINESTGQQFTFALYREVPKI